MLKRLIFTASLLIALGTSLFAQELVVTNTIGGNSDKLDGGDLVSFSIYGTDDYEHYSPDFTIADRLQLDFNYKWFTTRGRVDAYFSTYNNFDHNIRFNGFAKAQPIQQIGIIAGNSFFSNLGTNFGELYALDDLPTYGKLLKDGVGLCSTIPFGSSKIKLKMAGGLEFDSFYNKPADWIYSGGFEVSKKDLFSAGATARNFTQGAFGKYAVMGGYYPGDFAINAGFIYNNTNEELLPKETKYSLSLSGGYKNKDLGFKIYADLITGLNNQYLATSDRKTKTYDGFIPFMTAFRGTYSILDNLDAGLSVKYTKLLYKQKTSTFTIYPNAEYQINDMFTLSGGLRLKLDTASDKVLTDYSLPLDFKFKLKTKFKKNKKNK